MGKNLKRFLMPLVPAVVAFVLAFAQPLYALDNMLCDALYAQLRTPSADIVIVGIEDSTLAEYGTFSTWSRMKAANLVDTLYADGENAPAAIAFDLIFQGDTSEVIDGELAGACEGRDVIVAGHLVFDGKVDAQGGTYDTWNATGMERSYEALDAVVETGFSDAYISADGITRAALLEIDVQGQSVPSFANLAYRALAESKGDTPNEPATANGACQFFFAGKSGDFQHVALEDVLDGTVPASEFAGKLVLVGAYTAGMQDAYAVASDRGTNMNGVEVHANIVQALADGATALPADRLLYAIVLAVLCYVLFLAASMVGLGPAIGLICGFAVLHLVAGWLLARNGTAIPQVYALVLAVLMLAYCIMQKYVVARVERKSAMSAFGQYVDPKIIEKLTTEELQSVELGGETREVSVLFVDIRGFTTMSEGMEPSQVVEILNEYLGLATDCIQSHGGTLDKFVGDCAMAVFNAPFDQEDYLYESVAAAWDIAQGSQGLSERLQQRYGRTVSYGIGVNCGLATIGNIGCDFRKDYTAIGDTVNTAARLEANAPRGEIYISQDVKQRLEGRIETEYVGPLELKGKANVVHTYRVTGVWAS